MLELTPRQTAFLLELLANNKEAVLALLGSAAFSNDSAFATAAQGALADTALQATDVASGAVEAITTPGVGARVTITASPAARRRLDIWVTESAAPDTPIALDPPPSLPAASFAVVTDANGLYNLAISGSIDKTYYVHVSFGTNIASTGPLTW